MSEGWRETAISFAQHLAFTHHLVCFVGFSHVFLCLSFYCRFLPLSSLLLSLLSPILRSSLLPSLHFPPLLHVLSSVFIQDYESKLQALQKQVETRSLAAETTEEEEEEEEGEI